MNYDAIKKNENVIGRMKKCERFYRKYFFLMNYDVHSQKKKKKKSNGTYAKNGNNYIEKYLFLMNYDAIHKKKSDCLYEKNVNNTSKNIYIF